MADAAVVLLIVLTTANAAAPHTAVVGTAVRDALGENARVLVEERETAPSDDEARELAARLHADAVAELAWSTGAADRALLHVFVAGDDRFHDREIAFQPADAEEERERAVGLMIGAMVREAEPAPEPRPVAPPPQPPAPAPVPVLPPPREAPRPPPPPENRRRGAIDVAATSALAIGGSGSGVGPAVGARYWLLPRIAARASALARFGTVNEADASTTALRVGAGASLRVLGARESEAFSAMLTVEAIALDERVRRDTPEERHDRWIGGVAASVTAGWRVSPSIEPYVGVGLEAVFGTTPVAVDGRPVATIMPFRTTADLGVALRF